MNRNASITIISAAAIFLYASCDRRETVVSPPGPAPDTKPMVSDRAEPANFSYNAALGNVLFREVDRVLLEDPFPRSILSGPSGLEVFPSGDGLPQRLAGDPVDGLRFDAALWGTALRGDLRYRIIAGTEVVSEVLLPIPENTGDRESEQYRELWRYRSSSVLTAGPLAFEDVVVVATSKPSFLVLDRNRGTLLDENHLTSLPNGLLFYLDGVSRVAAFGADGSVSLYELIPREKILDSVESALRPTSTALPLIEARLRDRLGKRDEKPSISFLPFPPRAGIPDSGVALFRIEAEETRKYRLYVDGAALRPYLLEIFDDSGDVLASNLDYVGLEAVLEYGFEAGKVYFLAVAFLGQDERSRETGSASADPGVHPRLVMAPK